MAYLILSLMEAIDRLKGKFNSLSVVLPSIVQGSIPSGKGLHWLGCTIHYSYDYGHGSFTRCLPLQYVKIVFSFLFSFLDAFIWTSDEYFRPVIFFVSSDVNSCIHIFLHTFDDLGPDP